MRQSSNNHHKVSTVLQGRREMLFLFDQNPLSPEDWFSFETNDSEPEFSQTIDRPPESAGNNHRTLSSNLWSKESNEITDVEIDYWQQNSSEQNVLYDEPLNREPAPNKEKQGDYAFDDYCIEDETDTGKSLALFNSRDISLGSETHSSDSFGPEVFADDFLEQERGKLSSSTMQQHHSAQQEENLDYLFGETNSDWDNLSKLEQGFLKATMATSSADYFKLILQVLEKASLKLGGSAKASIKKNSARSPLLLKTYFSTLNLLLKRYGSCGLSERILLTDAIELFPVLSGQSYEAEMLIVLAGLTTRVILKPHIENGLLSPTLIKRLLPSVGESIKLLAIRNQLKALPGLVARLNQLPVQDCHGLNQLPKQLDHAILQVTQHPQLYQQLCRYAEKIPADKASTEAPQRLRIDGPVEICFRRLNY